MDSDDIGQHRRTSILSTRAPHRALLIPDILSATKTQKCPADRIRQGTRAVSSSYRHPKTATHSPYFLIVDRTDSTSLDLAHHECSNHGGRRRREAVSRCYCRELVVSEQRRTRRRGIEADVLGREPRNLLQPPTLESPWSSENSDRMTEPFRLASCVLRRGSHARRSEVFSPESHRRQQRHPNGVA